MNLRFWRRPKGPSEDTVRAQELAEESQRRLEEAQRLCRKVATVTDRLRDKNYRNGWGEVIAETMNRRGSG